jgi:hypothetical protein
LAAIHSPRGWQLFSLTKENEMATFATCQDANGRVFFVNVDLVRVVEQGAGYTIVKFDKDHTVNIQGPPAVITNLGKKPDRPI